MLLTLHRCATCFGLLLFGSCNDVLLVPPPEGCQANSFTKRFSTSVQEKTDVIFVLDDSEALAPQAESVRRAILDGVRRFVDLPCDVDAALRGADCQVGALDRRHYQDLGFAVLLGGYDACSDAPEQPLGRVLLSPAAPVGIFEWHPSELAELSHAGAALGRLLRDLEQALATVEFSSCHIPQPLEAIYELLAKPEPAFGIEHFRAHTGLDFLRVVLLLGSDDQSGWPGALNPVERYVNLFDADAAEVFCPDHPTFSSTDCAAPLRNPLVWSRFRLASLRLVGPETYPWPQCELQDPFEANDSYRDWSPPDSRVEQFVQAVGYAPVDSHPWCFEANAAPASPQFLFPTFNEGRDDESHTEPFWCLPSSMEFEEDADSPALGQANCLVVEAHSGEHSGQCSCEGSHRAPLRDEIREIFDRQGTADSQDYACYCELFQLSGPELWECQHLDAPQALEQEAPGYCLIDPRGGFGDEARVERCFEDERRVLRFLGRNVPAPASDVFLTCSREHCDVDSQLHRDGQ